ncbi:NAD(P)/FAD-dependent oxidoreductase [Rarobacter faecitabidus]|uniref:NADH dehydrogenase n=1 Tax=Rarobacter faecitabidus TaxID=13243 RepID=A0A542ZTZ5_RARFA|nr:FAD-dependent oxidoreductase [Rarobacter faecitabidus]TQL63825.1 NADH dehydrogenase [Rarobacter faecitabidus]
MPSASVTAKSGAPRILVLGGGSVGLYSARRLRRRLGSRARITVVDALPYMTYAPFLPEVGSGAIGGRDVVAPFLRALRGIETVQAKVTGIDHAGRKVTVSPNVGPDFDIEYDELVIGLGSIARTLPIPGLAEEAIGFKHVEEALYLRNKILDRVLIAAHTEDEALRKRLLTFTFIGGGFAGIEAVAEAEDMARAAVKKIPSLSQDDLKFVVIEGADRILPELPLEMAQYGLANLRRRGIDVHLSTFLSSCVDGHVVTSTGVEFDSDTIVWTAGVRANPVIGESDLPTDKLGRLTVSATLQVIDYEGNVVPGAWGAGDCAAVPDLYNEGKFCPPNAQHAIREAKVLADNLVANLAGRGVSQYKHKNLGTVASLGLHKGVAVLFGVVKLKGWPAWFAHRAYHVMAMPTPSRKTRIIFGWLSATFLRRELGPLGATADPRASFRVASAPPKPREEAKKDEPAKSA